MPKLSKGLNFMTPMLHKNQSLKSPVRFFFLEWFRNKEVMSFKVNNFNILYHTVVWSAFTNLVMKFDRIFG